MKLRTLNLLDLQKYAATEVDLKTARDGKVITTTYQGYADLDEGFYEILDRSLSDAIYEEYTFEKKYCDTINVPQNKGEDFAIDKFTKYDAKINELLEGVTPPEDEPMGKVRFKISLADYGGYATFTNKVDIYSKNGKGTLARLQKNQALSVGEKFQYKVRDVMYSSPNRWFAGVAENSLALATLEDAREATGPFNLNDFRAIRTKLKRMKVKPFEDGYYHVAISPEVEQTLYSIKKTADNGNYTFLEMQGFKQNVINMEDGSIGTFLGFKFFVEDALGEIKDIDGNAIKGANDNNLHGCVIFGKFKGERGLKVVKLDGYGKPKTVIKKTTDGGAKENPLNQIGSVGWTINGWSAMVFYAEAVMVYECESDITIAEPFTDEARANYVKGVTGKVVVATGKDETISASTKKNIKQGIQATSFTDDEDLDGKTDPVEDDDND